MIIHTVAFQWKAQAPADLQQKAREELAALQSQISHIQQAYVGTNVSANAQGYTLAATLMFADQQALDAYMRHPAHQALVGWLDAWVDLVEIDIEA